ncbi:MULTISPECIES: hypothetical protein [Pseudoalteromonas]|uniref:Uncharacterized protein n=1 Tax=Pseudoalteromonas amylolytica TaxID=1859457 RepID=A0A1S1MP10_9GAMM|nr:MULTISPECIES: hypothetical protein [Pseudoalteromonas]OHU84903.1 hypothetical protein BFC16_19630 [Pseudoalteromonas sp. JW3]OHU90146.1 hypothetical protein BET10_15345 [Pseudoalteromonas amylolytica]
MKRGLTHIFGGPVLSGLLSSVSFTSDLSQQAKQQTISKLSAFSVEEYVFEDVAKKVSAQLQSEFDAGKFSQCQDSESFAKG